MPTDAEEESQSSLSAEGGGADNSDQPTLKDLLLTYEEEVQKLTLDFRETEEFVFDIPTADKMGRLREVNSKLKHIIEDIRGKAGDLDSYGLKSQTPTTRVKAEPIDRAKLSYWQGKASYNDYCVTDDERSLKRSEEKLTEAVKLDPSILDGWNTLGEVYWRMKELQQAQWCFEGSLDQGDSKIAMVLLSKLLRVKKDENGQKASKASVERSLDMAKRAVKLDLKDGELWFSLGNAYLHLFFNYSGNIQHMQKCISAYTQAKKAAVHNYKCHPDLHFNRGTVYKYLEEYQKAFEDFSTAAEYADDRISARQHLEHMEKHIFKIDQITKTRNGIKPKRLMVMIHHMTEDEPDIRTHAVASLTDLKDGENKKIYIYTKFLACISREAPIILLLMDDKGTCMPVSIYNCNISLIPPCHVGHSIVVKDPVIKSVEFKANGNEVRYKSIHVTDIKKITIDDKPILSDKSRAETSTR